MTDTFTPTLNLTKPGINESQDTWGTKLNGNSDIIDSHAAATQADITALEARCAALETEAAKASWVGEVRMHSGTLASIANIPGGVWKLCDGQEGRPNLIDKMIMGAGGATAVGATGGAASWTGKVVSKALSGLKALGRALTVGQLPSHNHPGSVAWTDEQGDHFHTINTVPGTLGGGIAGSAGGYNIANSQTSTNGRHGHNVGVAVAAQGSGEAHDHDLPDLTHDHDIGPIPTVPPYYALAFVIRTA